MTEIQLNSNLATPITDMSMDNSQNPLAMPAPITSAPVSDGTGVSAPGIPNSVPNVLAGSALAENSSDLTSPTRPNRFGHFGAALAKALDKNPIPLKPNGQPVPGGWARSLVGAAQTVLSGLSDVSSTPVANGGSGIIEGISQTLANRQNRIAGEQQADQKQQQQQFENNQTQSRNAALNAYTQAQTVALQRTSTRLDDEDMEKHIASGKAWAENMSKHHEEVVTGETEDQILPDYKTGGKYDPAKYVGHQTGSTEIQKNGKLVTVPTYSIYKREGGPVVVDAKAASLFKNYSNQDIPEGASMDGDHYDALHTQAEAAQVSANILKKQEREEGLEERTDESIKQHAADLTAVNPYLGAHRADPITALDTLANERDPKTKQLTPAAQAAGRLLQGYDPKELETHRHDIADEAIQNQKAKNEKDSKLGFQGDPKLAGNPQAFFNSLAPEEQNIIREAGTGQMTPTRMDYLQARNPNFLEAVASSYPDFDQFKAQSYGKEYQDFTAGKVGNQLKAGSTALEHLKKFYDNTDYLESRLPGTETQKARETDFNNLALELAKFSNGGTAPTKEEINDAKNSLGGDSFYSVGRKSSIKEQVGLMQDSLNDLHTRWKNAAPSKYYQAPMPYISKAAIDAADYIKNDGQYVATDPSGTQHKFSDQQGLDTYYGLVQKASQTK